jgi:hypothetical protein
MLLDRALSYGGCCVSSKAAAARRRVKMIATMIIDERQRVNAPFAI